MRATARRLAALAAVWLAAGPAAAHDSWLSPSGTASPGGAVQLELTTGNRFPVQEFGQTLVSVVQSQCSHGTGLMPLRAAHPDDSRTTTIARPRL